MCSESQTLPSAHKHKHASPTSARNASHYALFEPYQTQIHRGGRERKKNSLTRSCGSTRPLQKARSSTNIPFVHASCVMMCIVHLSYFIFHNHSGEAAWRVAPGPIRGMELLAETQLQISHGRNGDFISPLNLQERSSSGSTVVQKYGTTLQPGVFVLTRCCSNSTKTCFAVWKFAAALSLFLLQQNAARKFDFLLPSRSSVTNQQRFLSD